MSETALAPDLLVAQLSRITAHAGGSHPSLPAVLPERVRATGTLRRLYEVALRQFAERGFHAVSVRDLTRELGLQASSLYAHVPSKQHLLADLIRAGHEEHRDSLRLAMLDAGTDPVDQIVALTRAHVGVHATYAMLTRVSNRELAALRDDHRAEILAIRLDSERFFLDVIDRGQRLGAFTTPDAMLAVAAIGAMGMRIAEWWHPDVGITVDEVAAAYGRFAVKILA